MTRAISVRPGGAGRPRPATTASAGGITGYLQRSERPLHSLAFLLPLICLYEFGSRFGPSQLIAFAMLQRFFDFFGATAQFLPAGAVIVILLTWHIVRADVWDVRITTLAFMAMESIILSIPLLALSMSVARWHLHIPLFAVDPAVRSQAVIAVGAGIYEELVFRLIGLTVMHLVLVDVLRMPKGRAGLLMVVSSGILFSMYHYLGTEPFSWQTCVFRSVAGIYFGAVFLCRGFGITAGCHSAYDVIAVALLTYG